MKGQFHTLTPPRRQGNLGTLWICEYVDYVDKRADMDVVVRRQLLQVYFILNSFQVSYYLLTKYKFISYTDIL